MSEARVTLWGMDRAENDPRTELLYQQAVRGLQEQQAVVESIRLRAGILLSAASIATSFLSGLAIRGHRLNAWGWSATLAFVGVGVLCLMILWPTRRWTFRMNAKKVIRDYIDGDPPAPLAEMHRDLALHMENWSQANSRKMRWLFYYFQAASLLLGLDVVLWIGNLRRR